MQDCKIILIFRDKDPYEDKNNTEKLKNMKYSQAISSSDIFGEKEEDSK